MSVHLPAEKEGAQLARVATSIPQPVSVRSIGEFTNYELMNQAVSVPGGISDPWIASRRIERVECGQEVLGDVEALRLLPPAPETDDGDHEHSSSTYLPRSADPNRR